MQRASRLAEKELSGHASQNKSRTHHRLADETDSNECRHALGFIGRVGDVVEKGGHEVWPLVVRQFDRSNRTNDLGSGGTDSLRRESGEYYLLYLCSVRGIESEPPLRLMQSSRLIAGDERVLDGKTCSLADERLLSVVCEFIGEGEDVRRIILRGCLFELFRSSSTGLLF